LAYRLIVQARAGAHIDPFRRESSPARGGETEFVSTRLAFERLDAGLRDKLDKSFAWHDYAHSRKQITADLASPEERAALPPQCWRMVWKNPTHGRGAIYLASHAYAVEGMEAAAGKQLIDELMAAATAPGTSYLHQWQGGDVVMLGQPRDHASRTPVAGARAAPDGPHDNLRDRGGWR